MTEQQPKLDKVKFWYNLILQCNAKCSNEFWSLGADAYKRKTLREDLEEVANNPGRDFYEDTIKVRRIAENYDVASTEVFDKLFHKSNINLLLKSIK